MSKFSNNFEHTETASTQTLQRKKLPPRYKVLLLNDDFTPMDFVIEILVRIYNKTPEDAEKIMLEVHTKGKAVAGIYYIDVASTKIRQTIEYATSSGFPLMCDMEEE